MSDLRLYACTECDYAVRDDQELPGLKHLHDDDDGLAREAPMVEVADDGRQAEDIRNQVWLA